MILKIKKEVKCPFIGLSKLFLLKIKHHLHGAWKAKKSEIAVYWFIYLTIWRYPPPSSLLFHPLLPTPHSHICLKIIKSCTASFLKKWSFYTFIRETIITARGKDLWLFRLSVFIITGLCFVWRPKFASIGFISHFSSKFTKYSYSYSDLTTVEQED